MKEKASENRKNEPTVITTAHGMEESMECMSTIWTSCHHDVVGRFICSVIFGFFVRRHGISFMNREWESIRLWSKVERLSGQGPRTMCQLWQCFREFCVSSVPVRRATDCTSQEFKQRWLGRTRFQNGFVFFEEGLSGDFSRHTQCRGGATYG